MKLLVMILLFIGTLFAKTPDIVSVKWLQQHYNDPYLILIDVRNQQKYKQGHLKHAVNIPALKKLFYGKEMLLPPLSKLRELFSNAGIDETSKIVVYGGTNPIWAARFYWISKVLGANNIGILKVNYGNWEKDTFTISTKSFTPHYKNFTPNINNKFLKTKLDVLTSFKSATIVDGRPYEFYIGKKSHAKRYGHILHAINLPGNLTYEKDGKKTHLKNFTQLKKIYINLDKTKPVILYCEDGADAAINFLVLKKLGFDVSVYDGSWLEWGNDQHLPIETPHNRK